MHSNETLFNLGLKKSSYTRQHKNIPGDLACILLSPSHPPKTPLFAGIPFRCTCRSAYHKPGERLSRNTATGLSGFESNPLPFPIFRSAIDRDRRRSSGKEKLTRTRRVTRPLGTWTRFARKKKKGRVVGRGTWIPFHSVVSRMYVAGGYSSSSFPVRTSPFVFTSDKTFFWSSGPCLSKQPGRRYLCLTVFTAAVSFSYLFVVCVCERERDKEFSSNPFDLIKTKSIR
jgi:hypothetical protein